MTDEAQDKDLQLAPWHAAQLINGEPWCEICDGPHRPPELDEQQAGRNHSFLNLTPGV